MVEGRGKGDTGSSDGQNYFYTLTNTQDSDNVVTGLLTISSQDIYALIDPASTFFYVTPFIASKSDMKSKLFPQPLEMSTSIGDFILASPIYRDCTIFN